MGRNGFFMCGITALASRTNIWRKYSFLSNDCIPINSFPVQESALLSAGKLSRRMRGKYGPSQSPAKAVFFISPFPNRKDKAMEAETLAHKGRPVNILLIEDNDGDVLLTQEAFNT